MLLGDYDKITRRHWLMFPRAPGTNYQDKETVRCHIHCAQWLLCPIENWIHKHFVFCPKFPNNARLGQWPGGLVIWRGVKISDLIRGHWKDCNVPGSRSSLGAKLLTGQWWTRRGDSSKSGISHPNLSLLAFILMAMQDKFMGGAQSQPRSASELLDWIHSWMLTLRRSQCLWQAFSLLTPPRLDAGCSQ